MLKTTYRFAAIIGLWSIIIVPIFVSNLNETKTTAPKDKPENNSQTKNIQQTTPAPEQNPEIKKPVQDQQVLPAKTTAIPLKPGVITGAKEQAVLINVVDGDTISVSLNGKNETIRIIGINTPETVDPRRPAECLGKEASNFAKSYFEQKGKSIWLERDASQGERDKYNRLLRYIFTDEGTVDYGKVMIALGYANEYTYNTPYKYQEAYKLAEKEAQEAKKGLWADNACESYTSNSIDKTGPSTIVNTNTVPYSGGDKDCRDFATHAEAQAYFDSRGGNAGNNIDRLDGGDHDGVVCESLP